MQVAPIISNISGNYDNTQCNPAFGHGNGAKKENNYTTGQKTIVGITTAMGVAASLAFLAKKAGCSLKPSKMFSDIKNSYLAKVEYHDKEVITLGIGSCLGGLAGGYLVDKDAENRKAKRREAVMQVGNVSIPILTVEGFANIGKKWGKTAKSLFAISGIFVGVYIANILMNLFSNALFKSKTGERGVKATDFSAHLDDAVVAASYISDAKIVKYISRIIPLALMFAGNEVAMKTKD